MSKYPAQPAPTANSNPAIWDLVIADMKARDSLGLERYGTRLQAFNGRYCLQDAYEEALDLSVYLKQAIVEREALQRELDEMRLAYGRAVNASKCILEQQEEAQRNR